MHKLLLTLVLGLLSFPAIGKANPLLASPTQDSIFKQVFHVTEGEYDLYIISTCIIGIGEVYINKYYKLGGECNNLAMLEQEFIFTKNGRTIKQFYSPVRRKKVMTTNCQTYSLLEIPVDAVGVMVTNNEIYYSLKGDESDQTAPSMNLVYDAKGNLIIYSYQADYTVVEIDGLLELSPDYRFELNKDSYKDYNKLVHSAIDKWYFFHLAEARYYPPYNEEYKYKSK